MTPILSEQDVKELIQIRVQQDKNEFANTLKTLLVDAARTRKLKESFAECLNAGIAPQLELCDLDRKMNFRSGLFDTESILNEYSVLEKLEVECGKYVQAYYFECSKSRLRIALIFAPPSETQPSTDLPFSDPIWDRRLEKETSW
jgi:hypothetical protein